MHAVNFCRFFVSHQVNAAVAGGATGALFSLRRETGARTNGHIVTGAITGAAVSTAAEFLRQL